MTDAFICDAIRTPIGRYGGSLKDVRADDLGAIPMRELMSRNPSVDWSQVDDVIYGCANQAGEDNRNVAHMASLLAGLPPDVPGTTVNRLCGSGMDAIGIAARAIKAGETQLMIAGGVESMTRAPFVMGKADSAFSRQATIYDTTIGWRFPNKQMKHLYGTDSMPETAENVAVDYKVSREDQDRFALASQQKVARAQKEGLFADEIVPVLIPQKKGDHVRFEHDEHPRETSIEALAKLKGVVHPEGSVTAGNASGVNDGACALLIASGEAAQLGMTIDQMDIIELNEAFASQALAVLRELGVADDDPRVNPYGGGIALGHPLGMSGARLVTTAMYQLHRTGGRYALCTMCIGVGQGIAMVIERV